MKIKHFLFIFGLFLCSTILNAQMQTQVQMLDGAILSSAVRIGRDLPAGTTIAIIHFNSDSSALNDYVVNELYGAILRNRRIVPILPNQNQLQNITNNLSFNEAGELIGESAQAIGQFLGVQQLITGTIARVGSEFRLILNVVATTNTESRNVYSTPVDLRSDHRITLLLGELLNPSSGGTRPAGSSPSASSTDQLSPAITGINVFSPHDSVIRGWTQRFFADVIGTNNPPQTVIWSLTGTLSENTVISEDGVLTAGSDETSTEITVHATSTFNDQISGTLAVIIRDPTVTEITVTPANASVGKGKKQAFAATVIGTDDPPQDVTWAVSGSSNPKTTIDANGVLTVASSETGNSLTVQATSVFDNSMSRTILVMIAPPPVNWISVEGSILGVGIRYERSLSNFFSLGANGFWQTLNDDNDFGITAIAKFFPGNSFFFLELGAGYGSIDGTVDYSYQLGGQTKKGELSYSASGFLISPSVGLRFGRMAKGLYADVFFSVPMVIGSRSWKDFDGGPDDIFTISLRYGIGAGYAW